MGWRTAAIRHLRGFTYRAAGPLSHRIKRRAELFFWRAELERYVRWYEGEPLYGIPAPLPEERASGHPREVNAAMTFLRVVQFPRYLAALQLGPTALRGKRVLDVGCGPFPSLLVFEGCERYGVDPLIAHYRDAGYPIDLWAGAGFTYTCAAAEHMPFPDDHFGAVVSVNALDHVDDFAAVAQEIRRVLRPGGLLRLQINFHEPTVTEPVSLDDAAVREHYGWVFGLRKLSDEPQHKAGERVTLWSGERPPNDRKTAERETTPQRGPAQPGR